MRIKTWQDMVIGLLALFAIAIIAVNAWLRPYDMASERAAARAVGLPLTAAELARAKPPAARDAMPEWRAFSAHLEKHPMDTSSIERLAGRNGTMPASAMPAVRRVLGERPDIVSRIHGAAAKPEAYFKHDYTLHELMNTHYAHVRLATKVLRWESASLAQQGRYSEAVRTQELGLNIADQLAADPTTMGMLISNAVNAISTAGLKDILLQAGPNPAVAAMVEQAMRRHPVKTSLAHALKGEAVYAVNALGSFASVPPTPVGAKPIASPASRSPEKGGVLVRHYVIEPVEAAHLHWLRRMYEAAQHPLPARRDEVKAVAQAVQKQAKSRTPSMSMAVVVSELYPKAEERNEMTEAEHAVLIAAAQAMAYHARNGRWPNSLYEATPNPPRDPFSGKPIGYRNEGAAFVVYSVGPDGRFRARSAQPERNQAVFRYPRGASSSIAVITTGPAPAGAGGPTAPPPMPGG